MGLCWFVLLYCLILLRGASPMPRCIDGSAPFSPKPPLKFCSNSGNSCCNLTDDGVLQKQFEAMKVSDTSCASVIKSLLCAKCDSFSEDLFKSKKKHGAIPVLCNSTISGSFSSQFNDSSSDFCSTVWDKCQNISLSNSPFSNGFPSTNSISFKLSDHWKSKSVFCQDVGGSSTKMSVCYDGKQGLMSNTQSPLPPPQGLCLEKIGENPYLNMVAHPDGSNRVFLSNQRGEIWLATIPKEGSGTLKLDDSPFLDIADQVYSDSEFGLLGIAFHPQFAQNGRFFVSYNCDKSVGPGCSGRCSCNSANKCDPKILDPDNGAKPCQFHSVIAEYTVNETSSSPSSATNASPLEVRRIFTMGLPFRSHHGGQILFGPTDGYLYFMMGDGGNQGDPYNFAQNKRSLLGKIIRIDINNIPSGSQINNLNLWGNYSIPKDNPSPDGKNMQPEIFALGFRNPWRCSFDSKKPWYFFCGDVGQNDYEEVNLISSGGNYGWRLYEGNNEYVPPFSHGENTTASSINAIFPIMGYRHSEVNAKQQSASITGGYVYRSTTDPCMTGRYLYGDLYGSHMWQGVESPPNSGNFTSSLIPFNCAKDSPLPCTYTSGSSIPSIGLVLSFGEDSNGDVYVLAWSGIYRITRPSRCNYHCPYENSTFSSSPSLASGSKDVRSTLFLSFTITFVILYLSCKF